MSVCRIGCGACCIVISISSPIPGMPRGQPAGVWCVNLSEDKRCRIHGHDDYPAVCRSFRASPEMCGQSWEDASRYLERLERETSPE